MMENTFCPFTKDQCQEECRFRKESDCLILRQLLDMLPMCNQIEMDLYEIQQQLSNIAASID